MAHSICVIPINPNPFTLATTDNRIVTALVHGLQVVADSIPSYRRHARHACLDDWEDGLERAMTRAPSQSETANIDADAINEAVLLNWLEALDMKKARL